MRPLVVDRSVLYALSAMYALYALWGLGSLLTGILPIRDLSGRTVEAVWCGAVMGVSLALAVAMPFDRRSLIAGLTWAWLFIVVLYPIALIAQWFEGELRSPHVIALALAYLVIPAWHVWWLRKHPKGDGSK